MKKPVRFHITIEQPDDGVYVGRVDVQEGSRMVLFYRSKLYYRERQAMAAAKRIQRDLSGYIRQGIPK